MDLDEIKELRESEWLKPWEFEAKTYKAFKDKDYDTVIELGRAPLPTKYGNWTYLVFGDYITGKEHELLIFGNFDTKKLKNGNDLLLRVHSSCRGSELFGATNCECREELQKAMSIISKKGRGVIAYLDQEGAGNGSSAKCKAHNYMFEWSNGKIKERKNPKTKKYIDLYESYVATGYKPERRNFSIVADIFKLIGIKSVVLLTNNPAKAKGLQDADIKVKLQGIHIKPANKTVANLLKAKANKLGHKISDKHLKMRKI